MGVTLGLKRLAFLGGYAYSGGACAVGVVLCTLFIFLPMPDKVRERWTRNLIHGLAYGLVTYLHWFNVMETDFGELGSLGHKKGVILVANHPTYIDAVLMMSQWHNLFCLTKVGVMANPWVAAMARSAGYESNVNPSQLIENCVRRLREGENLLVFPEGTRTTTPPIGSLKRGFAVVAGEAQAPVVPIIVTTQNGTFLSKGQPFFVLFPPLPLRYRFSLGPEFRLEPNESARDFCQRVENYFRAKISSELLS